MTSPNEIARELLEDLERVMDAKWALNNDLLSSQLVASHIKRSLKPNIEALATSHQRLVEALEGMTEEYVDLVKNGGCCDWDPEESIEVINARNALKAAKGEQS